MRLNEGKKKAGIESSASDSIGLNRKKKEGLTANSRKTNCFNSWVAAGGLIHFF